jgi:hypothetical protein
MANGRAQKKRILGLAMCLAVTAACGVYAFLRLSGPRVSWSPVPDFWGGKEVRVSESGRYIGLMGWVWNTLEGRLLVYRVEDGRVSPAPVLDSWRLKKFVWSFGWAGDSLVYVATDGGPCSDDLARQYAMNQIRSDTDVSDLGVYVGRKHARRFQRDMGTGRENAVFAVRGIADACAHVETGDRPDGRVAISNGDCGSALIFKDLKNGRTLSSVSGDAGLGDIICWNARRDGVIVVYRERQARSFGEDAGDADVPCAVANISVSGKVTHIARVGVDSRSTRSRGESDWQAARPFAHVHTAQGDNIAYFKRPSDPDDALEVRFVPLDGGKDRKLTIRKRDIPMRDQPITPIAIMPNGRGVLVEIGSDRLYYCAFTGGCAAVPVKMRRDGVYRVWGSVGSDGLALEVHNNVKGSEGRIGEDTTVGIVSVH